MNTLEETLDPKDWTELREAGHRILIRLDLDRVLTDPDGRTERKHGCGSRYPRLVSPPEPHPP